MRKSAETASRGSSRRRRDLAARSPPPFIVARAPRRGGIASHLAPKRVAPCARPLGRIQSRKVKVSDLLARGSLLSRLFLGTES